MIKKFTLVFMYSTRYYYQILMNLEYSRQIFEKFSNINFFLIRPVGTELFIEDGWTDGHDEANSRFPQLCERT